MKNRSDIDTLIEQDRTLKIKQGLEFLESVILDVLREAKHNGEPPLDAGEITCRAGIPFKFEYETGDGQAYYRLTRWLLLFLEYKHDVERPDGRTWQITSQGHPEIEYPLRPNTLYYLECNVHRLLLFCNVPLQI